MLGYDWIHNRQLSLTNYYSARELVLTLVDTVSRGGNLLLNVGATADGRIPVIEEERLIQIGGWLKVNGEAIFGTRPCIRSCQWSAGERPKIDYGREWRYNYDVASIAGRPSQGRAAVEAFFTAKEDTLYAILPAWPSRSMVIKGVRPSAQTAVTMLGLERPLTRTPAGDGLAVEIPQLSVDELPCEQAYTLKLTYLQEEPPH
jgi:alpha-L-fucosidase